MIYLLTFLWCIPSPIIWPINAEAWVITNALLKNAYPIPLGLSAAAGQIIGFCALWFASERMVKALPTLDAKLATFDANRYVNWSYVALQIGTIIGVPPTILLTLCQRALGYRFLPWLLICCVGRAIRFSILAHLPDTFAKMFGAG